MPDGLSIQLYTLRSLNDPEQILDIVATAGFRWVEGVGSHLDDAEAMKLWSREYAAGWEPRV